MSGADHWPRTWVDKKAPQPKPTGEAFVASILLIAYNQQGTVGEAIAAALAQTLAPT